MLPASLLGPEHLETQRSTPVSRAMLPSPRQPPMLRRQEKRRGNLPEGMPLERFRAAKCVKCVLQDTPVPHILPCRTSATHIAGSMSPPSFCFPFS